MNPTPSVETFAGWLLVGLGVGIGWATGNLLVTLIARAVT